MAGIELSRSPVLRWSLAILTGFVSGVLFGLIAVALTLLFTYVIVH